MLKWVMLSVSDVQWPLSSRVNFFHQAEDLVVHESSHSTSLTLNITSADKGHLEEYEVKRTKINT